MTAADKTRPASGARRLAGGSLLAVDSLIKANSLRLGAHGLLLMGAAGAGKSSLTLALLERAALFGRSAALIGDDYSRLRLDKGALYAEKPPAMAGALEIRGAGIFQMPYEPLVRLDLAVELAGEGERYPQGHKWRWPAAKGDSAAARPAEPGAGAAAKGEGACLPLLKLPAAGRADMLALCQAIEARLFKTAYSQT